MADFDKSTFDPKAAAEARKKEMDQMAAFLKRFVFDIHRFQDNDNNKYGGNKRMQQADTRLSVQSQRSQISTDYQSQ